MENVPAYLRKKVQVEDPNGENGDTRLSRLSLDEVIENKYKLSDNNSFLHDNVD